jgi:hypothetical protein
LFIENCINVGQFVLRKRFTIFVYVQQRSLWYVTHCLMVMHPHTKYHWPISKEKNVMAWTRKYYLKNNSRSKSNEGHYGMNDVSFVPVRVLHKNEKILGREFINFFMKNIPQAYRPSYFWFWPLLILGGSVISGKSCEYVMTHVSQHQAVMYNTNTWQQHLLSMLKEIKEEIFCQLHRIAYKIIANCQKNGVVLC